MKKITIIILTLILLLNFIQAQSAYGDPIITDAYEISRSKIDRTLREGNTFEDFIEIQNNQNGPLKVTFSLDGEITSQLKLIDASLTIEPKNSSQAFFQIKGDPLGQFTGNVIIAGDITPDPEFNLADSIDSKLISWNQTDLSDSKIYITDYDSNVDWLSLQAIGKQISGTNSTNDIQEIDTVLGSTSFADSVESLYLNAGEINETLDITIFGNQIQKMPVANSITSPNFKTGILWDTSDDSDAEYDSTEQEDIIFISERHKDTAGSYETVDYELRVPAKLRSYHLADQTTATFYIEIN